MRSPKSRLWLRELRFLLGLQGAGLVNPPVTAEHRGAVQQAQADIDVIARRIREKDKRDRTFGMHVRGLRLAECLGMAPE
jgi:hypothetical protein